MADNLEDHREAYTQQETTNIPMYGHVNFLGPIKFATEVC